ncbi:MAG: hypothetical protein PHX78_10835 [bacterium]|nr:hypothetical protein [bacterium]
MTLTSMINWFLPAIIAFLIYDWLLFPCGKRVEIFEARDKILKIKLKETEWEIHKILDKSYVRGLLIFFSFYLFIIFGQRYKLSGS